MHLNHFTGARHKLQRADTHLHDLTRLVFRLGADHPIGIKASKQIDNWIPLIVDFNPPDTSALSLVAADAIQNLRAALDLAASALARKNGVTSNTKLSQVYFPIGNDRTDWHKKCAALGTLIGSKAQKIVEGLDVYPGGSGSALKVLAKLSNTDKHRLLLPTVPVAPTDVQFGFNQADLKDKPAKAEMRVGPLMAGKRPVERGDVLLFMACDNAPITRLNIRIRMSIGFDAAEVPVREQALETLSTFTRIVTETLGTMETA